MRTPKPSNQERDPAASTNEAKPANENGQGTDPGVAQDPRARVEQLEQECARLEAEVKAGHEKLLRERADLENFKKRSAREREESLRYGTEGLVRDLLPVIDNLERALQHADAGGNGEPLAEGVRLVLESLRGVLERHRLLDRPIEVCAVRGEVAREGQHVADAQLEGARALGRGVGRCRAHRCERNRGEHPGPDDREARDHALPAPPGTWPFSGSHRSSFGWRYPPTPPSHVTP